MILNTLWWRVTRSLLTVLGIAIGVVVVMAFGAMAQGITMHKHAKYAVSI